MERRPPRRQAGGAVPLHRLRQGLRRVRSTIEKIVAKLENKHWMFTGEGAKRAAILRMCEDCRVEAVVNESFDPHHAPQRPPVRTSDDYLRERAERGEDPLG
jgi:hypothetical protein